MAIHSTGEAAERKDVFGVSGVAREAVAET
jgi:hypothetical protein